MVSWRASVGLCVLGALGVVEGFRMAPRSLLLFEYLEDRKCESARSALIGAPYENEIAEEVAALTAECQRKCEESCPTEPTFDIKVWRECLMGLGRDCEFKPLLWIANSIADNNPTFSCLSESGKTLGVNTPGIGFNGLAAYQQQRVTKKSIRFFVPDTMLEECAKSYWRFSAVSHRNMQCEIAEGAQEDPSIVPEVITDNAEPIIVRDRLGNGYLFFRTDRIPDKVPTNFKIYLTTDRPECLKEAYDTRNWIGSPRLIGALGEYWQVGYGPTNNTDLAIDQRNSFFLGRVPYGFEME